MATKRTAAQRFGFALRRLRQETGLTQAEFARRVGVAQANVSRYERGLQWIESNDRLQRIAETLVVPAWAIVLYADVPGVDVDSLRRSISGAPLFFSLSAEAQAQVVQYLHARNRARRGKARKRHA